MGNDLKESNIEKNKEFNNIARAYLIISSIITVIAAIVFYKNMDTLRFVLGFASLSITIGLLLWTYGDNECPECAARKYEKRLSTDLVSETFLGNKTKKELVNNWGRLESKYKKYAVYNRKYNYNSICKYCDYEWSGTYTAREEEEL